MKLEGGVLFFFGWNYAVGSSNQGVFFQWKRGSSEKKENNYLNFEAPYLKNEWSDLLNFYTVGKEISRSKLLPSN